MATSSTPRIHKDSLENPYYLGKNDHFSLLLVSDRLTGANDFNTWHRSMQMALNRRNKLSFVDGSLPKPADNDPNSSTWSRCNDVVRSWLLNSVSDTIGHNILHIKTAEEMWKNLIKRFKQRNVSRLYQIEQQLRQGSMDVNEYYTKAITIWEEIKTSESTPMCVCSKCICGLDQQWMTIFKRYFVIRFLYGLNETYEHIREQIIMMDSLPDLEKTFEFLIQNEHQRQLKTVPGSDAVANGQVTEDEICAVLMEKKQVTTQDLVSRFKERLKTKEERTAFADIMKKISKIQKNSGSRKYVVLRER